MESASMITVAVKYGTDTLSISVPASAKVHELLAELEARTGLIARRQKLLAKGKVVSGQPNATLLAASITDGAKLMLLAGGTQTQGQAALASQQQQRIEALQQRRKEQQLGLKMTPAQAPGGSLQQRAAVWAKTGIVSLRGMQLEQLPDMVFSAAASSFRVLDASDNKLTTLPPRLLLLTGLQRLRLSSNALADGAAALAVLSSLTQLSVLALDSNRLSMLPPELGQLINLRQLSLADNQLTSLPAAYGTLTALRSLQLQGNRLSALPADLACCSALEELDASGNQLQTLPPELGRLTGLRVLLLDANKLRGLPPELLCGCSSLATLSLHDNPITAEQLRELPGYAEYDARRRAKYDKMLGMKVDASFDEGADTELWEHWKQ